MIALLHMLAGAAWVMAGMLMFGSKDFTGQAAFEQFCTLDWPVAFLCLVLWPLVLIYARLKRKK